MKAHNTPSSRLTLIEGKLKNINHKIEYTTLDTAFIRD